MKEDEIVVKNYKLQSMLGKGAFGEIWKAINMRTNEEVAIKFEDATTKYQQLYSECKIYLWFHSDSTVIAQAIPNVLYYGVEKDKNIMVMDLLGKSLEALFTLCGRQFKLKTVLMIADQMIKRIEYIHSRRIIHRDIKPDNFAIGKGNNSHRIYIIDFGLAKKYMSSDGKHIPYKEGKSLTGTARYASISTHIGIEQARRDDLESLGYLFVYFLKGKLPWQNLKAKNTKDKYEHIKDKKIATKVEKLCEGLPAEFIQYISYCRAQKFEAKPDYSYLRGILKNLFKQLNYEYDYEYDWVALAKSSKK